MHYPDGDNIITDNDGASWFTDGPPATTLKADVMNALVGELANILKAYNIPLKNSGNDTFDQIAGALIARDQGKTREASVVIASSDSDENARLTADVVISTNEDASVKINAQMVALNATGGGKIFLRAGNYYCGAAATITMLDNINIFGEGPATVIYSGIFGGSEIIFDAHISLAERYTISDLKLSSTTTGYPNNRFIYGNAESYSSSVYNITLIGGGIWEQNNLSNIYSYATASKYPGSFVKCKNMINCIVNHTIQLPRYVAVDVDFDTCVSLTNCISINAQQGYKYCRAVVNCGAIKGSTVFQSVGSAVYSAVGFYGCSEVTLCYAQSFVSMGVGFVSCIGMMQNHTRSVSTGFITCYADRGGFDAVADRSVGGWNVAY